MAEQTGASSMNHLHGQVINQLLQRFREVGNGVGRKRSNFTISSLCQQLGVSQRVLREAIKVLQAKGVIDVRPMTGISVRPLGAWKLLDLEVLGWRCEDQNGKQFIINILRAREVIEPAVTALAAMRASDQDIATINTCTEQMSAARDNLDAFMAADKEFHAAVYAACDNELLAVINAAIWLAPHVLRVIYDQINPDRAPVLKWHQALAAAIARRDRPAPPRPLPRRRLAERHRRSRPFSASAQRSNGRSSGARNPNSYSHWIAFTHGLLTSFCCASARRERAGMEDVPRSVVLISVSNSVSARPCSGRP